MGRDAQILEKLLLVQSSLALMPDEQHLADFLLKGLDFIPDLEDLSLCIEGRLYGPLKDASNQNAQALNACAECQKNWPQGERPVCYWEQAAHRMMIEIQTLAHSWGCLLINWKSSEAAEAYRTDLVQLSNQIGMILENRHQQHRLEQEIAQREAAQTELIALMETLEERVAERTDDLQREMAERNRIAEQFALAKERAERYFKVAGILLIALDDRGNITTINPRGCQILGGTEAEILGRNWFETFLAPDQQEKISGVFRQLMQGQLEPVEHVVNQIVNLKGEVRSINWHNSVLYDEDRIVGIFSSGEDITERETARQALYDSEQRFKGISETAPDGILLCDDKGRVVFANRAAERLFEQPLFSQEAALLNSLVESAESLWEFVGSEGALVEAVGRKSDGTTFPLEISLGCFEAEGQTLNVAVLRDISERKRNQAELEKHAHKLAARNRALDVLNRLTTLTAKLDIPVRQVIGELIEFLPQGLERPEFGCAKIDYGGQQVISADCHVGGRELSVSLHAQSVEVGRLTIAKQDPENEEFFPSERALLQQVAARLGKFFEERRAHEEIRKLSTAVSQSPTGILITDNKGQAEYANAAYQRMAGMSESKLLGRTPPFLEALGSAAEEFWRTVESGKRWQQELQRINPAMEPGWEEFSASPIYNDDGQVSHLLIVRLDITERRKQERALNVALQAAETSNRAKSNFLATMSHELRTPMNGILGMASCLLSEELDDDLKEQIQVVYDSGNAMVEVLDEIFDASRLEAGAFRVFPRPLALTRLCESIIRLFSSSVQLKGLQLDFRFDPTIPEQLRGDPLVINQVISNLLANAIKFTEKGRIGLNVYLVGRKNSNVQVALEVSDSGVGIDPAYMDGLFDPFSQEDGSTTRRYGGVGLGLSTVKRLVDLMGGGISVESVKGEGTRFRVELPLEEIEPGPPLDVSSPWALEPVAWARQPLVLLAEDDPINQRVIQAMIDRLGCRCEVVGNGIQALEAVRQKAFDLVLMDCLMPEMDGYEATQIIRQLELGSSPHILALTARSGRENQTACQKIGMDGFLAKPLTLIQLKQAVEQQLAHLLSLPSEKM